jgi:dTDP-4-dehydrorhamnose 3,5-epimerase
MEVEDTNIPGVCLLKTRYFSDERGFFVETYSKRSARDLGVAACFVQDNQSLSLKRGTVRALHFQVPPKNRQNLFAFCAAAFMMSPWTYVLARRPTVVGLL